MGGPRRPALKFLHDEHTLNSGKIEAFRRIATLDILRSLSLGTSGCLKTRPDGTVLDGHHRLVVLLERGIAVNELDREIIEKQPMTAEAYWIPGPWRGRLAIVARPRGGDWLEDEVRAWSRAGFRLIVSLLEDEESAQLGLRDEETVAAVNGLRFLSFPIPDRGVPSSAASTRALAAAIRESLQEGSNVALHCRQSVGRSGLIAAAILADSGTSIREAIDLVSAARGIDIPETPAQRDWLYEWRMEREPVSL